MSKLILQMQTSVDALMSADDPALRWQVWNWSGDWPWDSRLRAQFNATLAGVGTILLSPLMAAEGYLDHWTAIAGAHPDEPDFAFAGRIVTARKVTVSRRHRVQRAGIESVSAPLRETVDRLKQESEGDVICFGGIRFASALVAADLVDEYQLYVNPAVVGSGRTVLGPAKALRLVASAAFDCGIVVNRYAAR